jgi:hypothetical protein
LEGAWEGLWGAKKVSVWEMDSMLTWGSVRSIFPDWTNFEKRESGSARIMRFEVWEKSLWRVERMGVEVKVR